MTQAIMERQATFIVPEIAPDKGESILDNAGVFWGYLALFLLITHKYSDEVFDDKLKEAHSKLMDTDLRRCMTALNTSHTSLSGGACYRISGLDGYDSHARTHVAQKTNTEYIPHKFGVKGY